MNKLTVLVCNDDGKDSPLLVPLVEALGSESWSGELRVVVPEHERSWIGTAVTRREALSLKNHTFGPQQGYTVSGTPADCANIGVFSAFKNKPDLLVSGINLGENIGKAYFVSSGTVGAALMGALCGVPSVAISVRILEELRLKWLSNDYDGLARKQDDWQRIVHCGVLVVRDLVETGAFAESSFFSVNMPWDVTADSPRKLACVSDARFNRLFAKRSDGLYEHDMDLPDFIDSEGSSLYDGDSELVDKGVIAITPVEIRLSGVLDEKLRMRLER